jgi:hypothetical protein
MRQSVAALATALAATPLMAAERNVPVTDFDRLRVEGAFAVEVRRGAATSARIVGSQAAIEAASVTVNGRQLVVRHATQRWGGYPGQVPPAATIRITVPRLSALWVTGPATVDVARLEGLRASVSLEGSGRLTVAAVAADRLDVATLGAGALTLGGTAAQLTLVARGSGPLDLAALAVRDAKVTSESAGEVTLAVARAVEIAMTGSGSVTVVGKPACTVRNTGAGSVRCGSEQAQRR